MKDAAKRDSFNLWLACRTQDEIAEAVGWPKMTINDWLRGLYENGKDTESVQTHDPDPDAKDASDSPFVLDKAELAAADHAFKLWLSFWKQDAIAEQVHWPRQTVSRWLASFGEKPENGEFAKSPQPEDDEAEAESPLVLTKEQLAVADRATDFKAQAASCGAANARTHLIITTRNIRTAGALRFRKNGQTPSRGDATVATTVVVEDCSQIPLFLS